MFHKEINVNQSFEIIHIEDHSLTFFRWEEWISKLLTFFLAICALVSIIGTTMIIFYIAKHAPKERPINRMILIDQVRYISRL